MRNLCHHGVSVSARRFSRRRGAPGQGLVEFALVFPLIILLLMGIFDLGRAIYAYNTVANAARQGARVAAVNQVVSANTQCDEDRPVEDPLNPDWSIKACAASSAIALGIPTTAVTVSYSVPPGTTLTCGSPLNVGCIANVTVTYSWRAITPIIGNLVGPITMTSTSQIPIERVFP
jgi:Flp pilus assembly protein TadG